FEPHVISLSDEMAIAGRIANAGVPVESMHMNSALSFLPAFVRLVRRLRALRPDIVHTWMYHADFVGGLAARLAGVPAVTWSIHNFNLAPGKVKGTTRFLVRLCALVSGSVPTKIICCSREAQRVHLERGYDAGKFTVVPNGVDTHRFTP